MINKHNSINAILLFESIILHLSIRIRLRLGIDFVNYIISNIQDEMKFVANFFNNYTNYNNVHFFNITPPSYFYRKVMVCSFKFNDYLHLIY